MSTRFPFLLVRLLTLALVTSLLPACSSAVPTLVSPVMPSSIPLPTPTKTSVTLLKAFEVARELRINGAAVTLAANCSNLLADMSDGIVLGMDPYTCKIAEGKQTDAVLEIDVLSEQVKNVLILKISWPVDNIRGLRANVANKTAQIRVNEDIIWEKSAFTLGADNFFYAARSEPIVVTFVPKSIGRHTIAISLPAGMVWDIGTIELSTAPYPENMLGIAYSPYQDCQSADTPEDQPIAENIRADLYKLAHGTTAFRTYSATGINANIVPVANELDIPVYAGAWLDGDPRADELEMQGILSIAKTWQIEAAIIGNEYYLRHKEEPQALNYLLNRIRAFNAAHAGIPVATAEIDSFVFDWNGNTPSIKPEYRPILDEIDILLIHIYPFWAYQSVDGAAAYTIERYVSIRSLLNETYSGTKRLILGEAGWPALGSPGASHYSEESGSASEVGSANVAGAVFHAEAQRQYMIELLALAQKDKVDLFYFSAFDELWKTEGMNGAGTSWGYQYSDRTAKFNFSGLLLPPEALPSPVEGDIFNRYGTSDFTWKEGEYPIYTEWPREPKAKPASLPDTEVLSPAFMGDKEDISMFQCARPAHSGETAIEVNYQPAGETGWSGVYWLYPEQNWGVVETGLDLQAARQLRFWARGKTGNEVVEFMVGGVCAEYDGITPPLCPDTIQPRLSTGPIVLLPTWQQYALDLSNVDHSNLVGAFAFAVNQAHNPEGATFYLDDIRYSADPPNDGLHVYPLPMGSRFAIYTDYAALDNHYIPSNFMGDGEVSGYLTLTPNWERDPYPYSGKTAIQIKYTLGPQGWAGIYWTDPENNWGQRPGGYDLRGATSLKFWARSDTPGTQLHILVGGIGCRDWKAFPYHDSLCYSPLPDPQIILTREWQEYSFYFGHNYSDSWSRVLGGFGLIIRQNGTFYLDDIVYEMNR